MTRSTHTFAVLELTQEAYDEIREKMDNAGYEHAFMEDGTIDMHGLAIKVDADGPLLDVTEDDAYQDKTCPVCEAEKDDPCTSLVSGCEMSFKVHKARTAG